MDEGLKVLKRVKKNHKELFDEFVRQISKHPTRPLVYIGLDENNGPYVTLAPMMTHQEMAFAKTCLEMTIIREWFGFGEEE